MIDKSKKILGLGEIMLRLTAHKDLPLSLSKCLDVHFGGAESNVICNLAILGNRCKFMTKIPNNPLGKGVLYELNKYGVDTSDILLGGDRLGTYYLDPGHSLRTSNVIYDRKYSSFYESKFEEYDFDKILEDVGLLHISGIIPALNDEMKKLTLEIVKECKKRNILVSYDSNYRMKLWTVEEAGVVLKEVLKYVDIAFLGILDMENMLKYEIEGDNFDDKLSKMYSRLNKEYPNIKYMASTQREIITSDENRLRGFVYTDGKLYSTEKYYFTIVDRVGTGDAFTSGIIHAIKKGNNPLDIVKFGTASSVLKHSYYGDINFVNGEEDIINFVEHGITKIKR